MKPATVVRSAARRALIAVAHDATNSSAATSILVVAPHPDDETLGCGARILRARAADVAVAIVVIGDGSGSHATVAATDASALRERRSGELAQAAERLGVPLDRVRQLNYADDSFATRVDEIAADLAAAAVEFAADEIYVTCTDEPHPDHSAAGVAVTQAVAGLPSSPRVLEYPIWLWADWPISRRFRNGSGLLRWAALVLTRSVEAVSVGDRQVGKRRALAAYRSQLGEVDLEATAGDYQPAPGSVALPVAVVARAVDGPELFFRSRSMRRR
jgi:LmbE family N-acetylglucosaminyl deacetylase